METSLEIPQPSITKFSLKTCQIYQGPWVKTRHVVWCTSRLWLMHYFVIVVHAISKPKDNWWYDLNKPNKNQTHIIYHTVFTWCTVLCANYQTSKRCGSWNRRNKRTTFREFSELGESSKRFAVVFKFGLPSNIAATAWLWNLSKTRFNAYLTHRITYNLNFHIVKCLSNSMINNVQAQCEPLLVGKISSASSR